MPRSITEGDISSILALASKVEMFDEDGIQYIEHTLNEYFSANTPDIWLAVEADGLAGIVYCAPEPMTDGTWNVLMLIVEPGDHGRGHGQELMAAVEQRLQDQGQRLLIVETSGLDGFERARDFYSQCGYQEEARIADFYEAGDAKVVFTKSLTG